MDRVSVLHDPVFPTADGEGLTKVELLAGLILAGSAANPDTDPLAPPVALNMAEALLLEAARRRATDQALQKAADEERRKKERADYEAQFPPTEQGPEVPF